SFPKSTWEQESGSSASRHSHGDAAKLSFASLRSQFLLGTKENSNRLQGGVIMLVLTRRPGEESVIDGNIRLTVVSVKGDRIRIGIEAPSSVTVDRQEI